MGRSAWNQRNATGAVASGGVGAVIGILIGLVLGAIFVFFAIYPTVGLMFAALVAAGIGLGWLISQPFGGPHELVPALLVYGLPVIVALCMLPRLARFDARTAAKKGVYHRARHILRLSMGLPIAALITGLIDLAFVQSQTFAEMWYGLLILPPVVWLLHMCYTSWRPGATWLDDRLGELSFR